MRKVSFQEQEVPKTSFAALTGQLILWLEECSVKEVQQKLIQRFTSQGLTLRTRLI
jgi:hypothetical protein